ncbi:hypothetical protein SAMN04487993_102777 [Salipiger marinus]|uniref:Uncharacterized protein n=2 Tax=Salipiger marinus TaxID=555512 RepID=A0A1G8T4X7_9RHOB|nr:hypothetical protein SAMN04487993_102777 [Salipiger marinus]
MAWGCDRVIVMEPYIHDCLQTNLHELAMLFPDGAGAYEAAAIKVSGYNASGRSNPLTGYSRNVIIQGGKVERVTMPVFYRSQTPKPEDTGAHISVEGFKAYDCSRDVWFEVASSVRINHCELIRTFVRGASQPRANGVLFFGNGTRQFTVTNSELYGRINTNEKQNLTLGLVANSILQEEAEAGGDPVFDGTHLRDVIIESYGRQGFRADHASGVTLISDGPRSQVRYQGQVAAGRLRWQGTLTEKLMTEGQTEITGLVGIYHISRIRRRNPKLAGGKWFPVHPSDYTAYAALGTVVFALGAEAGDMVQIEWSARHDESFVAGAGQTVFTGSQPGGHRVADMNSVRIDNVAVPSRGSVADPATDPHWTLAVSLDGLPIVTLVNHPALAGGEVVRLVYRPPLQPYASAGTVGGDRPTALHLAAVNVGASRISGDSVLRGSVTDCAETCFEVDDGVALELDRVDVLRAAHGVVRPTGSGVMRALRARGGIWKNWGMASGRVGTETHLRYAVGGNRPANMLGPREDLQFDGVTFWRDRNEGPASGAVGGNTNSSADRAAYSRRTGCEFINTSGLVSASGTVGTLETPTVLTL